MSTKNTKENRKVVRVTYWLESIFKIPDDLDLEDKSVVSEWYVKYNILNIIYADGKEEEIEATLDAQDTDYKYPKDTEIEDDDQHLYSEEDD